MDLYVPMYLSTFREKGLSGNDAVLYSLLCHLCRRGGTVTRSISWLAGEINVSKPTIKRSLETIRLHQLLTMELINRGSALVCCLPTANPNVPKRTETVQNVRPLTTPYVEKENIVKEKIIKKEFPNRRPIDAQADSWRKPLTWVFEKEEQRAAFVTTRHTRRGEAMSIGSIEESGRAGEDRLRQINNKKEDEHDMSREDSMRRYAELESRLAAKMHDPGDRKKQARAVQEEWRHRPLVVETPEQQMARLKQQAFERGRNLAGLDRELFMRALPTAFHDQGTPAVQEMLRQECLRGFNSTG